MRMFVQANTARNEGIQIQLRFGRNGLFVQIHHRSLIFHLRFIDGAMLPWVCGRKKGTGVVNSSGRAGDSRDASSTAPLESIAPETAAKPLAAHGPSANHRDMPISLIELKSPKVEVGGTGMCVVRAQQGQSPTLAFWAGVFVDTSCPFATGPTKRIKMRRYASQ